MRILIYDRNENYKCGLSDLEKAVHEEELNGKNILKFSLLATTDGVQHLEKNGRVLYKDRQGYWQEFILREIKESHANNELIKEIYCEHSFYETLGDYVEDKRPYDVPANTALADALLTTRWEVGIVHDLGINSTNFYHISAKEAVQKVAEAWEGELRYRVEVAGTKITHRYVDLLARRGADRGKRYEYTKDLLSIIRTVRRDDVITALYGYGKGEEIEETGGYGRRITFEDVEWSVANGDPIEKPLGQTWVGDPEVLEQWGRPNGDGTKAHIFDKVEFDQIEEPGELLRLTWEEYQKRSQVQVSYEGKVADLKTIDGLEHEGVELGDTVAVIDKEFNPPLRVKARVLSYKADLLDPSNDEVVLGNFIDDLTSQLSEGFEHINNFRSRSGVWDRANTFNPDGFLNAQYLENLIDEMNTRMNSQGGYVYVSEDGKGLITYDKPADQNPTMAVQILGGAIRVAASKNPDGSFAWRTFITGRDITADLINTGILQGGKVRFDVTNGTLLMGDIDDDYYLFWDGTQLWIKGNIDISANETIGKITEDMGGLATRLDTAEGKITPTAIVNTVRNSTEYTIDLGGKEGTIHRGTEPPADTAKLWLDTYVTPNILKRYDGTSWIKATPTEAAEVKAYSASAGSSLATRVSTVEQTATDFTIKFEELKVGGENLLLKSDVPITTSEYLMKSYDVPEPIAEGEEVTIQIKGSLGTGKERFGIYNSGGYVSMAMINPEDRNSDGIYTKTFNWKVGSATNKFLNVYAMPSDVVVSSKIEWIKLERGNRATDKSLHKSELKGATYNFDGSAFKIGGTSGDKVEHTNQLSKYTHSDGSYTQISNSGLERFIAGTGERYHYLLSIVNFVFGESSSNAYWVQLPNAFKGKQFRVYFGIADSMQAPSYKHAIQRFVCCRHPDHSIDYANARVPIIAYKSCSILDGNAPAINTVQGIMLAIY